MGDPHLAAAIAFYSPDHPDVVPDFDLQRAPFVSEQRLDGDGFAAICRAEDTACVDEARRRAEPARPGPSSSTSRPAISMAARWASSGASSSSWSRPSRSCGSRNELPVEGLGRLLRFRPFDLRQRRSIATCITRRSPRRSPATCPRPRPPCSTMAAAKRSTPTASPPRAGRLTLADAAPSVRTHLIERFERNAEHRGGFAREASPRCRTVRSTSSCSTRSRNTFPAKNSTRSRRCSIAFSSPTGCSCIGDVVPPNVPAISDAWALLRFGAGNGFFLAALAGLVRTVFSDYWQLRTKLGLTRYSEPEMIARLAQLGFAATCAPRNIGHLRSRMTFLARPAAG